MNSLNQVCDAKCWIWQQIDEDEDNDVDKAVMQIQAEELSLVDEFRTPK
jgi:hypothetical protein